jgi:cell division protein FtsW (lipid II flippase)
VNAVVPALRMARFVSVARLMASANTARGAAGYGVASLAWLLAGRDDLAVHLDDARIPTSVVLGAPAAAVLIVFAAGAGGRRAAAHLSGAAAMLCVAGITLAYRFSPSDGHHQVVSGIVAAAAFLVVLAVGHRRGGWFGIRPVRRVLLVAGLVLIASPLLPVVGATYGGARLWLDLPGLSIEPGQIGAVAVIVALALGLAADGDLLAVGGRRWWRSTPWTLAATAIGAVAAITLTVASHDLGGATALTAATIALLAAGTHRLRYPAVVTAALMAGTALAWPHLAYLQARVAQWQHPLAHPAGMITQAAAARYAIAWGGLGGHGLGSGMVARGETLPDARSDYALIQLSAESGAVVAVAVIGMLAVVAVAAWTLARKARPGDDQLVAVGAAILLTAPAVLLVAGVTGLIPVTGTPFPLFGVGTSVALAGGLAAGLLAGAADTRVPALAPFTPPGGLATLRRSPVLAALVTVAVLAASGGLLVEKARGLMLARAAANPELAVAAATTRGSILTADGTVLATTRNAGSLDSAVRSYAGVALDPVEVTGVAIPNGGASGLEAAQSALLRCGTSAFAGTPMTPSEALRVGRARLGPAVNPASCSPADIVTTIDVSVQRPAVAALTGHHGVIVALDASTGAVLAIAANPTVNANTVVTPHPAADFARLRRLPANLAGSTRTPLYLPAFDQEEAPGSVFKLLLGPATATAHVATDTVPERSITTIARGGARAIFGNAGGELCGGDLTAVLTISCNTGAAQLATRAGRPAYQRIVNELQLTVPADISGVPASAGVVGLAATDSTAQLAAAGSSALILPSDLAQTAIGQASVRLTPIGVGTLTADILSGHDDVRPYLAAVACAGARPIGAVSTRRRGHPLPGAAADWPGLVGAGRTGTASALQRFAAPVAGLLAGAKTGTAQLPNGDQIGWLAAAVRYRTGTATQMAIVVAMVLPDQATPEPSGGIDAAAVAAPVLIAAAAHRPSDALLDAGRSPKAAQRICRTASTGRLDVINQRT